MNAPDGPEGLAVVDKPVGPTSHDVVAQLRRRLHTRRVGHAGTLDPGASGLLLVGVGRVTRLLRFLSGLAKSYEGELVLGTETTSLDADGEITRRHDMHAVTLADVAAVARGFLGETMQVPPMVSALKVGGRRLHELARAGVEVEREPRRIVVTRLEVAPTRDPLVFTLGVDCSAGTYIRSLAADIGRSLGGGAHLRGLRRTAIGSFTLAEATPPEMVGPLLSAADALRDRPGWTLAPDAAGELARSGRLESPPCPPDGDGPFRVVDRSGRLLAVAERRGGVLRPAVVLAGGASGA